MGDFERTFGAGRDAADVIDGLAHARDGSDREPCQAFSDETLVEVMGWGLAVFSQHSRKSFYDEGLMQAVLEEWDCDEFYDDPAVDRPLPGEHLLIIREPDHGAAAYIRVLDREVVLCRLCGGGGGEYSSDLVTPLFLRHGWTT